MHNDMIDKQYSFKWSGATVATGFGFPRTTVSSGGYTYTRSVLKSSTVVNSEDPEHGEYIEYSEIKYEICRTQ